FMFDAFLYPSLNTRYFQLHQYEQAMTVFGKLRYLIGVIFAEPANSLLGIAFCLSLTAFLRRNRSAHTFRFEMLSLAILTAMLFFSSFAPTPLRPQYFFSAVPFAILFVLV